MRYYKNPSPAEEKTALIADRKCFWKGLNSKTKKYLRDLAKMKAINKLGEFGKLPNNINDFKTKLIDEKIKGRYR